MSWKKRQRQIQIRLLFRQNLWLWLFLLAWMIVFFLVFHNEGHTSAEALAMLVFLRADSGNAAYFYTQMTQMVIFGLVVSVLMVEMQRQVRPETTCRIMAEELEGHAVIFHYSNLGKRVWQLLRDADVPVSVVEPDSARLEEMIREGYPCLVGSGRSSADLEAVNVRGARLVVVTCDDLESLAVICSLVRKQNPRCPLVARCFEDDLGEVLAKRYNATVISTTRLAAKFLKDYAARNRCQRALVVGGGQLARRMFPILQAMNCKYTCIVANHEVVDDLSDDAHEIFFYGKSQDRDLLKDAGIGECDLVILSDDDLNQSLATVDRIRQLNTSCKIVCRVFHDDSADMLSHPPFNCEVISTSRYAVDHLRDAGAFAAVGLGAGSKKGKGAGA